MEEMITMDDKKWKAIMGDTYFGDWVTEVEKYRTRTSLKPMDLFNDVFLEAVDTSYVNNLRKYFRGEINEDDAEDAYNDGMEAYLADVLEAAKEIVDLAEDDDDAEEITIVKKTLTSKLVFMLTPDAHEERPNPLMTKSFWEDVHQGFSKNQDAIQEVSRCLVKPTITPLKELVPPAAR
jgi:hypothetical protein